MGIDVPGLQSIRDAALEELVAMGIDDFTLGGVAARIGGDPATVIEALGDRRVLLMDALLSRARQVIPTPDTGTLRDDLLAFTASLTEQATSPQWRAWFARVLPASRDADLSEIRSDFWQVRFGDLVPIMERAADRGDLREQRKTRRCNPDVHQQLPFRRDLQ